MASPSSPHPPRALPASRPRNRRRTRSSRADGRDRARNHRSIHHPHEKPRPVVLPRQVDDRVVGEEDPYKAPFPGPLFVPPRPDLPPASENLDDVASLAAPSPARRPHDPHASVMVLQLDRLPPGMGRLPAGVVTLHIRGPREPGSTQQVIQDLYSRLARREKWLLETLGPQGVAVYLRDAHLHKSPPSRERQSRGMRNPRPRI